MLSREDDIHRIEAGPLARRGRLRGIAFLLAVVYAAGLTHDLTRSWTGYHDFFLGAFHSQFARNTLRYPFEVHHGIPMMAMGEALPPPEQRSLYATHPPGLVWMLCGFFATLGQAEWVARLLPIVCSLGAILLLLGEVARARDRTTAILAGLIYAVLPLAVFFGRLVDHEAVCLCGMLAVVRCMGWMFDRPPGRRTGPAATICLLLAVLIWIDWAGVLFAVLFTAFAMHAALKRRASSVSAIVVALVVVAVTASMLSYLVTYGLAGRWGDLLALAQGRTGTHTERGAHLAWGHTLRAFSWPVLALCALAAAVFVRDVFARRTQSPPPESHCDARHTPSAMIVLHATGFIWLFAFWRQYEIHNYWVFYLGPLAAIASARAILWLRSGLSRAMTRRKADICCVAMVVLVIACCLRRTDAYFRWTRYKDEVRAWKAMNAMTQPNERVLLPGDPRDASPHGTYVFRNIMPPPMAYYLDRPWTAVERFDEIVRHADDHALFMMKASEAAALSEAVAALRERFTMLDLGPFVAFDLRQVPKRAATSPSAGGVDP